MLWLILENSGNILFHHLVPLKAFICSTSLTYLGKSREHWSGNTQRKVNNARAIPMRSKKSKQWIIFINALSETNQFSTHLKALTLKRGFIVFKELSLNASMCDRHQRSDKYWPWHSGLMSCFIKTVNVQNRDRLQPWCSRLFKNRTGQSQSTKMRLN